MSDPVRFLTSFAQAVSTMALYSEGHPARERVVDRSYEVLRELQQVDDRPEFSFMGDETVYRHQSLRDMRDWEWAPRLAAAGVQRLEFEPGVSREDYVAFLEEVMARLTLSFLDSTEARPERRSSIRFGALGIRGESEAMQRAIVEPVATATITYTLGEEAETVRWMHREVQDHGGLPLVEAEAVVRSLSLALHGERDMVLPLLELREFDEYTTTHSLNVSMLTMALAEHLGLGAADVRAFGVAGLLHDLGKVRIPREILVKPGKLTDEERAVMQAHPVEGARIIVSSDRELDLAAAVAYEHHMMIDGGGYPHRHYHRGCHPASELVHVCDVYDALRTKRPYRDAWPSEKALAYIEERVGVEFAPEAATAFVRMMRSLEENAAVTLGVDPTVHPAPAAAGTGSAATA